jgi:glycosyltransferase involved in cell wall biosynthesis
MSDFSVSMAVYIKDDPEHFDIALDSIFNQTIKPSEVILVVDGPVTDEINEVINKYEKKYTILKVIRLEENKGHGEARRIGLENCTNELVALMDSDDLSLSDRFEKQLEVFERDNKVSVVGGNIAEFNDEVNNIVGIREVPAKDEDIKKYMKSRCPFNQVTVMFKKSQVMEAGGYIDWYCEEDYYLWLRMYLNGVKFYNLQDILVKVRVGKDMYKRRGGIKYFKSEKKLQKYMLRNKIINYPKYLYNVMIRFVLQILMPNSIRGFLFKRFARKRG